MTRTRRLAVIPARGGSKRVPRKNIRDFHDKPIMVHVLETVRDSGEFDAIHVSTEDEEIADVARKHGVAPAFPRSPNGKSLVTVEPGAFATRSNDLIGDRVDSSPRFGSVMRANLRILAVLVGYIKQDVAGL